MSAQQWCTRAELWLVLGRGHGRSYGYDPVAYVDRVVRFFEAGLK